MNEFFKLLNRSSPPWFLLGVFLFPTFIAVSMAYYFFRMEWLLIVCYFLAVLMLIKIFPTIIKESKKRILVKNKLKNLNRHEKKRLKFFLKSCPSVKDELYPSNLGKDISNFMSDVKNLEHPKILLKSYSGNSLCFSMPNYVRKILKRNPQYLR